MQNRRLLALMMAAVVALSSVGLMPLTLQAAGTDVIEEETVYEEGVYEAIAEDATAADIEEDGVYDTSDDITSDADLNELNVLPEYGKALIAGNGMVAVNVGDDIATSANFDYELYRKDASGDTLINSGNEYTIIDNGIVCNWSHNVGFWLEKAGAGTYYVACKFYDSRHETLLKEINTPEYEYTAPTAKLKKPGPISRYLTRLIKWPVNDSSVKHLVEEYKDGKYLCENRCGDIYNTSTAEEMGAGVYEFRVYAISPNIFETCNSDYSSFWMTNTGDGVVDTPSNDPSDNPSDNPSDKPSDNPSDQPGQDQPGQDDEQARVDMFYLTRNDAHGVYPGDTFTITAIVGPENAANKNVKWKVVDADTGEPSDAILLYAGGGATANTIDSGTTVKCYAVREARVRVIAYLEAAPEWQKECYCEISEPDIDHEEGDKVYDAGRFMVFNISDEVYNGSPIKFEDEQGRCKLQVYDEGGRRLEINKDFTVSYENNVNAGTARVIITPIGNYAGEPVKVPFTINPVSLKWYNEETGETWPAFPASANMTVVCNDQVQKVVPVINMNINGKKVTLKQAKEPGKGDFTCSYTSADKDGATAYKDPGDWEVTVTGTGNFTGEVVLTEVIMGKDWGKPLTACKITPEKSSYTFAELEANPVIKVKVMDGKTQLKESQYVVEPLYDFAVGKNTVNVYATEPGPDDQTIYCGCKEFTCNVVATKLTPAMVDFGSINDQYTYTGRDLEVNGIKVDGKDYGFTVKIQKGINVGTGSVTVTGDIRYGYTGSVTKKFKIVPADVSKWSFDIRSETADGEDFDVKYTAGSKEAISGRLTKGGAMPDVGGAHREECDDLVPGRDYTVKYSNNKIVGKTGTILIAGKGNFKGSKLEIPFEVVNGDISRMSIMAPDKVYSTKKNAWKSVPVITDKNGKKLSPGKDYDKNSLVYEFAGKKDENSIPTAGTIVRVSLKGAGSFAGPNSSDPRWTGCFYKILDSASKDIGKANFKIKDKAFIGRDVAVELEKEDFVTAIASDKKTQLKYGEDFIITGYDKNTVKGTAKVFLMGQGSYGGTKTVTFNITGKTSAK